MALAPALLLAGCASAPATRLADLGALQQRVDRAYARHHWAAAGYGELVKQVPGNAAYWFRLGDSEARLDQPQTAVAAYRRALQRDPSLVPAWHNPGSVLLAQAQAAFAQAGTVAKPADPLQRTSKLLAVRVAALRDGESVRVPSRPLPGSAPWTAPFANYSAAPATSMARGSSSLSSRLACSARCCWESCRWGCCTAPSQRWTTRRFGRRAKAL